MKSLLAELTIAPRQDDPLLQALDEAVRTLQPNSKGGIIKTAKAMFKHNPGLVVGASMLALSAHAQYKKNKRNTITLHAADAYEKKMMTSVVDALINSKRFRLHRSKYEQGGRTWILKKI